jgi:hypothetical protein
VTVFRLTTTVLICPSILKLPLWRIDLSKGNPPRHRPLPQYGIHSTQCFLSRPIPTLLVLLLISEAAYRYRYNEDRRTIIVPIMVTPLLALPTSITASSELDRIHEFWSRDGKTVS